MNNHLLQAVYQKLPISLQNVAFTAYGLRLRRQRYGPYFYDKLEELKSTEWWTAEQIDGYQNKQLSQMVQLAYESVPYYRQLFQEWGVESGAVKNAADLEQIPLLTKQTLRESSRQLISQRFKPQSLLTNQTSGTTGTPLTVYLTREALQFQWAVWWRHRARFGLRPGDKHLSFGARLPVAIEQTKPPFWRYNRASNQVYLSMYHLTPEWIPEVVDWLNHQDFDFYTGYPSAMYALASQMKAQGLRLLNRPKVVSTGADALLPVFAELIGEVFGVTVTEQYGMAEACGNLSKCEYGRFHLDFEFGILELLPIPGLEDSDLYKLVFTGLANPAMPLIRYDVGDYGRVTKDPCPCGRASLVLEAIDGRIEDFVRTPDGRLVIGMNQVFKVAAGVSETQIVQERLDEIEVRLVPASNFDWAEDCASLEEELRKRIGNKMKINFSIVEYIPRSKNGKFRAVINNLPVENKAERELRASMN
jgi:phenylacetate-CoA ligase